MACLVVFTTDRNHRDPAIHALAHKTGDVVASLPDDHQFSKTERMSSDWRIYRFPLVSVAEGEAFLGGHAHPRTGLLTHVRASRLDLAKIPADHAAVTYADLDAARVLVDPTLLTPGPGDNG